MSGVFKFKGSKMEKELDDMYAAGAIGLLSKPKDVYHMSETFQTVEYKIFSQRFGNWRRKKHRVEECLRTGGADPPQGT